jgi:uroporphyrinogen decarboxylase
VYIEAVWHLAEYFGKEVPVRAPGAGPFPLAGHLMGISEFVTQLAMLEAEESPEDEQRIRKLLEIVTESLCRFSEACVKAGAGIVQCADSLASLNMISPPIYRKYAFPYEKMYFDRINRLKEEYDFLTLLHICGKNTPVAAQLADTGCDILEVDYQVDLAQYKELVGDRVCLMGNLNPAGSLFRGTPEDVARESREAIGKAGKGGRFCLGSGCEVAVKAPEENIRAMVETGHLMRPF